MSPSQTPVSFFRWRLLIVGAALGGSILTAPTSKGQNLVRLEGEVVSGASMGTALQKSGFNSFAALPLTDGTVLRDVKIVAVGSEGVTVQVDGSSRFLEKHLLPEGVFLEAGGPLAPMFQELLAHGVVAKGGSPIFELVSPNPNASDFGALAKGARGGRTIAQVGAGYLLMEGQARDSEGAAVQFPKPLSKFTRGYVTTADFAHLGLRPWRSWWLARAADPLASTLADLRENQMSFAPVELGKNMLLLDPFETRYTLFGNEQGIMKRAWRLASTSRDGLAIVETTSGFYLGVLAEKSDLAESRMTWPELLAIRSGGYTIEKTGQRQVQAGSVVFQANLSGAKPETLLRSIRATQLRPGHYRTLMDRGVESTRLHMQTNDAEAVDILSEPDRDFSGGKEVEVEKVSVQFRSMAAGTVVLQLATELRERDVDADYSKGSSLVMEISRGPWRTRKITKTVELEKDVDGGLRFLDGDTIYELTFPKVGGYLLTTYALKANPLNRPPR